MKLIILNKDLRIEDNPALYGAAKGDKNVYVLVNIKSKNLSSSAINSIKYQIQALKSLHKRININFFCCEDEIEMLKNISIHKKIDEIHMNYCFTPYSINLIRDIKTYASKNDIAFITYFDYLLFKPGQISKNDGSIYKIFKPFYKKVLENLGSLKVLSMPLIKTAVLSNIKGQINTEDLPIIKFKEIPDSREKVLEAISMQSNYSFHRNIFDNSSLSSKIAAAINWGVISYREIVTYCMKQKGDIKESFLRQLIWREFYYQNYIGNSHYKIDGLSSTNILTSWNSFPWIKNENDHHFIAWKKGQTGFPLIDAAMNELNITGTMNNRARMLVASFLTKNLNVDWRLGERYFSAKLIDYDPVINNQSWQWASGCGLDYQGANRVFSPQRQQEKFDPKHTYINKFNHKYELKPIVDYKQSRLEFFARYKEKISN